MLYEQLADTIRKHDIPRSTIAKLSGLWLSDLSAYLNRGQVLNAEKERRLALVVEDVVGMLEVLSLLGVPIRPDLADIENVKRLVVWANDIRLQRSLFPDEDPLASAKAVMTAGHKAGTAA